MKHKKRILTVITVVIGITAAFCTVQADSNTDQAQANEETNVPDAEATNKNTDTVTAGTEEYRGFLLDNVFHSSTEGDIHYNVYIPVVEKPCHL